MRELQTFLALLPSLVAASGVVATPLLTASAAAQEPESNPLRISVAGIGGTAATLSVSYPTDPGQEQAQTDAVALAEAGGWTVSTPERAEVGDVVLYEAQITPAVTLDESGAVPTYPFLHAFRRFPEITFVFVGESAGAEGEFHDENRYIAAQWRRSGRVVTYEFRVKDASFAGPDEVALVERPADQPLPPPASGQSGSLPRTGPLWLLLVIGSVGVGVFVWGLTWWLLSSARSRDGALKEVRGGTEANQEAPPAPTESGL